MPKKNDVAKSNADIRDALARELNTAGVKPALRAVVLCGLSITAFVNTAGIAAEWQPYFRIPLYAMFLLGCLKASWVLLGKNPQVENG